MNNASRPSSRTLLPSSPDVQLAQTRLGARLAGALSISAQSLPHDVSERLRVAREQALARARTARAAQPARIDTVAGVSAGGAAMLSRLGFTPWWQRAASLVPLALLVAGLVAIDRFSTREQVLAAADIDVQLLGGELPPAAYSDPGFAEFLRSTAP